MASLSLRVDPLGTVRTAVESARQVSERADLIANHVTDELTRTALFLAHVESFLRDRPLRPFAGDDERWTTGDVED